MASTDAPASLLAFLTSAMSIAGRLAQFGSDIYGIAEIVLPVIQRGTPPTDADWVALRAGEVDLRAVLQAPLP